MFRIMLGSIAVLVLVGSGGAQVLPKCCAYIYDWPEDLQDEGGPCSGEFTLACEDGANLSTDPPAEILLGTRDAECCFYSLSGSASFVKWPCEVVAPPTWTFVGVAPNGQCCYAKPGTGDVDVNCAPLDFDVMWCEGICNVEVPS